VGRERPILFSSEMVRAILDGRKTVTRRVVKPQPKFTTGCPCCTEEAFLKSPQEKRFDNKHWGFKCPYGQPGDRLWVRETWAAGRDDSPVEVFGPPSKMNPDKTAIYYAAAPLAQKVFKWRPSIHMPRWASRLTLEVTGVRVERLLDIDINGIRAEGLPETYDAPSPAGWFASLWDSNAKRGFGWDKNPWVWVVEFKKLEGQTPSLLEEKDNGRR
jgi:hypothetical protein